MSRTINASDFKAKCLALIDQVADTGDPIVITKNGKPLVKLVPHRVPKRSPLGVWKDKVIIKGDIISPIEVEWDALRTAVRQSYLDSLQCLAAPRDWTQVQVGMAIGLVAHTAYHLGAIRQIAKATKQ